MRPSKLLLRGKSEGGAADGPVPPQGQAPDNHRVLLKDDDGDEIELGSIDIPFDGWEWGIDCVVPMSDTESCGHGQDRADCMRKFKAAWERFAADEASLTDFLEAKRRARQ